MSYSITSKYYWSDYQVEIMEYYQLFEGDIPQAIDTFEVSSYLHF